MTSSLVAKAIVYISAVLLLCNCAQDVQFSKVAEAVSQSSGLPPVNGGRTRADFKVECDNYFRQLQPVDLTATEDHVVVPENTASKSLGVIRNLSVVGYNGKLTTQSVVNVQSLVDMNNDMFINADRVGLISDHLGGVCVRANQIDVIESINDVMVIQAQRVLELRDFLVESDLTINGRVERVYEINGAITLTANSVGSITDVLGEATIRAQSVDSIYDINGPLTVTAKTIGSIVDVLGNAWIRAETVDTMDEIKGNIHLYGTKVKTVKKNSGKIFLHEGATIENPKGQVIVVP